MVIGIRVWKRLGRYRNPIYNRAMKPISVHVSEDDYQELKSMAARTDRPVAELIRRAMAEFVERERQDKRSVLQLPAHDSGAPKEPWTRSELVDEMRAR